MNNFFNVVLEHIYTGERKAFSTKEAFKIGTIYFGGWECKNCW